MSRRLLIAVAAVAALGSAAAVPASAAYVLSGKTEFGNAPLVQLTMHDCSVYLGDRLVSPVEYAKYLKAHPGYAEKVAGAHRLNLSTVNSFSLNGTRKSLSSPYFNACR